MDKREGRPWNLAAAPPIADAAAQPGQRRVAARGVSHRARRERPGPLWAVILVKPWPSEAGSVPAVTPGIATGSTTGGAPASPLIPS